MRDQGDVDMAGETDSSKEKKDEPKESKHHRFTRLSKDRVSAIRDKLNQLGNLSNRRHYEFSEKEVSKMFGDIEDEFQRTKDKFAKALKSRRRSGESG
jgi:hypothetical protein